MARTVASERMKKDGNPSNIKKKKKKTMQERLSVLFYKKNIRKANELHRKTKYRYTITDINKWLDKQETVQLLKRPLVPKKGGIPIVAGDLNDLWIADLTYVGNKVMGRKTPYKYLLTVVDVFSRFAYVRPLTFKSAENTAKAFEDIFKTAVPLVLQTDGGTEFKAETAEVFKKYKVFHTTTKPYDHHSQGIVEKFNQTIKKKIVEFLTANSTNAYMKQLQEIVDRYNKTVHDFTKKKPKSVRPRDVDVVRINKEAKKKRKTERKKLTVGDTVRLMIPKMGFEKGFSQRWTKSLHKILNYNGYSYEVSDADHRYRWYELQKITEVQTNPFLKEKKKEDKKKEDKKKEDEKKEEEPRRSTRDRKKVVQTNISSFKTK